MSFHSKKRFESWLPALFDGEFDWDFLKPAFAGTKIQPMDFDAVVERRGKFLIFETKIPGKGIEKGQRITLTEQWKQGATIFIVSGKSPKDINGLAEYLSGRYEKEKVKWPKEKGELEVGSFEVNPCDALHVVYRTRCWFCWASGLPVPTKEQFEHDMDKTGGKMDESLDWDQCPF